MQRSLKAAVFFCKMLSACTCSDDPAQAITFENAYCEVLTVINQANAQVMLTCAFCAS